MPGSEIALTLLLFSTPKEEFSRLSKKKDDSTAKRSFSPRRHREHGERTNIGTYEQSFKDICILRELRVSVVEYGMVPRDVIPKRYLRVET